MKKVLAAVIQLNAGSNKLQNIENAINLIIKAAHKGAHLIALPELFTWQGSKKDIKQNCEPIPGPTSMKMAELASYLKIFLLCGSILEENPKGPKPYNTSFLINPQGKIVAYYRKLHLFKVNIKGKAIIDENRIYTAGNKVKSVVTPFGKVGFTICYDLRFPELYRSLCNKGVLTVFVPSAFTLETGKAHWESLLRSRAIENQVYIIAPNQYGKNPLGNRNYGHSMIVDPWGTIIAQCTSGERIIYGELDFKYLKKIRNELPSLKHKRKDIFKDTI